MEYRCYMTYHPPNTEELESWTVDYWELVTIIPIGNEAFISYFRRIKIA